MRVLVAGASGFIGTRVVEALERAGHDVIELRRARGGGVRACVTGDFRADHDPAAWRRRLAGVDALVNAVGILRVTRDQSFHALHAAAPRALFRACVDAGVRRVIQISALGADERAQSRYHTSKREADRELAALPLDWFVLQPSLVFGPGGASARLFCTWAALPLAPLPGAGMQRLQPVHVEDLAALCVRLLDDAAPARRTIAVVGPEPFSVRRLLEQSRLAMGLGEPRFVELPMPLVHALARVARAFPGTPLDREVLAMLERGSEADVQPLARALGRPPRPVLATAAVTAAASDWAQLNWLLPLLRISIALVWIGSGIVSLGLYPVETSYALLARVGIEGTMADLALYGAATLDLLLGIGTLLGRRRRRLWRAQIVLIVAYTAIITAALPELWLHPFAPVLKNLPMLAAIVALHELDRRRGD